MKKEHTWHQLYKELRRSSDLFLGYPSNISCDYSELFDFFKLPLNNVGDPYGKSLYQVQTHKIERQVVEYFAKLYHISPREAWGYVTHGGTEGNLYGLYLARERFPNGVVYFSEDTHYSVPKIVHLLGIKHITVKSQASGEMDYEDLEHLLKTHRDQPAIVLCNIGTTMKGAVDQPEKITKIFQQNAIRSHYIHADAALGGMILPFLRQATIFDFRVGVDSIAVSGHKFIGMPFPSGVVVAKKRHVERVKIAIEYIGTDDTTISGSRNGISPLMLWYAISKYGNKVFTKWANDCVALAKYTQHALQSLGVQSGMNSAFNTVYFSRPKDSLVKKWQLAVQGNLAHIVVMPHTSKKHIDGFLNDLKSSLLKKS